MCPKKVISGHGRFNETYLDVSGRKKLGVFPVPAGITLTFYAPPGAALDNGVANRIEKGEVVTKDDVELKMTDGSTVKSVPTPYPYVFTSSTDGAIDFTVGPPDGLTTEGSPYTVKANTALRTVVSSLESEGYDDLHYACCGSGYSDSKDFEKLFPYRGWYVRLKS